MGRFRINFIALISAASGSTGSVFVEETTLLLLAEASISGTKDSSRLRISAGMVLCLFVIYRKW